MRGAATHLHRRPVERDHPVEDVGPVPLVTIANRFDTFAHFDALIEIDDAGLRMRY